MGKTYWVKKDPTSSVEWIEMNGEQFYEFITSPAGKDRYFMDCDTYKIEVSEERYRQWKPEANHHRYLQKFECNVEILSFDILAGEDGMTGDELFADFSVNVEDAAIRNIDLELLSDAICSLTDDEQWLINELYMKDKPKSEQEITVLKGIPQQTVNYRKNKILKKLKNYLVKIKKSQQ